MANDKQPSLDFLRTFLAVYRSGSFTAAAGLLKVTQPTITNHISQLENMLGVSLFTRKAGGVDATYYSHLLADSLAVHIDEIDRTFAVGLDDEDNLLPLRMGGPNEFITSFLIPAIAPVFSELPKLEISFGMSQLLAEELREGTLDIAILTTRPEGDGLSVWNLVDEEFVLVGAPAFAALDDFPLLSYANHRPIVRRYWKMVFGEDIDKKPVLIAPNLIALKSAAVSGIGVTVLPTYLIKKELSSGELIILNEPPATPTNTLYLAVNSSRANRRSSVLRSVKKIREAISSYIEEL